MSAGNHYDRDGQPLTLLEWAERFSDEAYKRVALSDVGELSVSTVWLGLDHNFAGTGPPLIFETMVFDRRGEEWLEEQWRYSTLAEAHAGHDEVVALVRARHAHDNGDRR